MVEIRPAKRRYLTRRRNTASQVGAISNIRSTILKFLPALCGLRSLEGAVKLSSGLRLLARAGNLAESGHRRVKIEITHARYSSAPNVKPFCGVIVVGVEINSTSCA